MLFDQTLRVHMFQRMGVLLRAILTLYLSPSVTQGFGAGAFFFMIMIRKHASFRQTLQIQWLEGNRSHQMLHTPCFRRWRLEGVWVRLHRALHSAARVAKGQNPEPAIVIMDSQSVKATEEGAFAASMAASV